MALELTAHEVRREEKARKETGREEVQDDGTGENNISLRPAEGRRNSVADMVEVVDKHT